MVTFDPPQQKIIRTTLEALDQEDYRFVIPRGYRDLPEAVPGSDIELLIEPSNFDNAVNLVSDYGFTSPSIGPLSKVDLLQRALKNPIETGRIVARRPREAVSTFFSGRTSETPRRSLRNQFVDPWFENEGIELHLHNHLAYTSPMFDVKVRVHPSVEEGMLSRRRESSAFPVPSPPDELAHLVSRGVFDYNGDFPDYYIDTCVDLWEQIQQDQESEEILLELLSDIFFAGDELVYELISREEYNQIHENLLRFAEY